MTKQQRKSITRKAKGLLMVQQNSSFLYGIVRTAWGHGAALIDRSKSSLIGFAPGRTHHEALTNGYELMKEMHISQKHVIHDNEYASNLVAHITTQNLLGILKGTIFQKMVWKALCDHTCPGETTTYTSIAHAIGKPKSVRAVANAIGANPISFFIPCHRVIRKDGSLGGYRWGLECKKALLKHEAHKKCHDA